MLIELMDHFKLMTAFELFFFSFNSFNKRFFITHKNKRMVLFEGSISSPTYERERDEKEGKATSVYVSCPTFFLPNRKHMRHILMFPVYL